jgi:ectoine hydroxylase-related dioxygenase (phytanoyl-CoA dioxygenase family)
MPAKLPRMQASDPLDAITEVMLASGGVIVERMLEPEVLGRLNSEVDGYVAAANPEMRHLNPAIDFFFGKKTRHVAALASKSRTFATEVLCHPVLTGVCDRVLLPSCARYQLNLGHIIDRGPGADAQPLHRDELVWVHVPRPHPELQIASMTALSEFTAELGATRLVPGSHAWPYERQATEDEVAVAELEPGSSVIYLGTTIHGAGANRTADRWRRGLHLSSVVGWLRTEENNYLATPPEVARTLPRPAQELIGYAVHDALRSGGGYLGTLELRDPVELMGEGKLGAN